MKRFLVFYFLFLLLLTNKSYGNGMPVINGTPPGFTLIPIKNNYIDILKEDLVFNIRRVLTQGDTNIISNINVKYYMKSSLNKTETVDVAFPYVGGLLLTQDNSNIQNNIKVIMNGQSIEYSIKVVPDLTFKYDVYNGINGNGLFKIDDDIYKTAKDITAEDIANSINKTVPLPQLDTKSMSLKNNNTVVLILFNIEVKPDALNILEIDYQQLPGFIREPNYYSIGHKYVNEFYYFLEPAKYWNSIKNLNIYVNLPLDLYIANSNLPLEQTSKIPNRYSTNFYELPNENFKFILKQKNPDIIFVLLVIVLSIISYFTFKLIKMLLNSE